MTLAHETGSMNFDLRKKLEKEIYENVNLAPQLLLLIIFEFPFLLKLCLVFVFASPINKIFGYQTLQ